jgi:hypothetical protein
MNDFGKLAYREMHVKTDLFCASNLVLPDKAGRQIILGGYSGCSSQWRSLVHAQWWTGRQREK